MDRFFQIPPVFRPSTPATFDETTVSNNAANNANITKTKTRYVFNFFRSTEKTKGREDIEAHPDHDDSVFNNRRKKVEKGHFVSLLQILVDFAVEKGEGNGFQLTML